MKYLFLLMLLGILILYPLDGMPVNKKDTVNRPEPIHKNVIKINPSRMIFCDVSNLGLSYERFIHKDQTAAISVGYLKYGKLFKDDHILNILQITSRQSAGFSVTLEYRFYPLKRNARPVPDGLYIGPFASYYGYWFENGLEIKNSSVLKNGKFNANFYFASVGFELGYQFVFWKRLTLDLVLIGPSITYYGGKSVLTGDISTDEAELLNTEFFEELREQYPILQGISKKVEFDANGRLGLFSIGYRYLIQIGFHF